MGWLDKLNIFGKKKNNATYASMLNGWTPIYSSWGQDIYSNDIVRSAIRIICEEIAKTTPTHLINNNVYTGSNSLNAILKNPNLLMAKSEFIEKILFNLLTTYNSYIIPTYEQWMSPSTHEVRRRYTGLFPVSPNQVEFLQDDTGELYIKMRFTNTQYETTLRYSDVIHIRKEYSRSDFLGGDSTGNPDRRALISSLKINDSMLKGIQKGIDVGSQVHGIVRYKGIINKDAVEKNVKELEQKIRNSESGLIALDDSSDFIRISSGDIKMVDAETLKFIQEKLLMDFGVSVPILTSTCTKEEHEIFYQLTLEPIIIKLGEAFSRVLLTPTQINKGHEIKFLNNNTQFMSTAEILEFINLLGSAGTIYENEKRVLLGLQPLEELNGVRMQSLNYVNVNIADTYQLNKSRMKEIVDIENEKEKKEEEKEDGN